MTGYPKYRASAAIVAALLCAAQSSATQAATFDDPDWPCIQRKVPELSIGQMWAGPPVDDAALAFAKDPDIAALGLRIALRRTPMDEAEALIDGFAEALTTDRAARLTALFAVAFDHIGDRRSTIIDGIARYAHKQSDLGAQIERRREDLRGLQAAAAPDMDRVELLQDELDWDIRIFRDRQQSLTYVCETPVILEQRIFALARMIMNRLEP